MYLCVNVQMNCHPVLFITCIICLGHFASRISLKSQYLSAFKCLFGYRHGKRRKKNHVREPKEAHFLILPCEKGDDGIFFFLNPGRFKELFWSTDA